MNFVVKHENTKLLDCIKKLKKRHFKNTPHNIDKELSEFYKLLSLSGIQMGKPIENKYLPENCDSSEYKYLKTRWASPSKKLGKSDAYRIYYRLEISKNILEVIAIYWKKDFISDNPQQVKSDIQLFLDFCREDLQ